ncbi:MAG TPA: hypothetical protein VI895_02755 [Bdellovibrionota bacterium]|nr:hypothetical protein [Bdellovibrionota bacterium]
MEGKDKFRVLVIDDEKEIIQGFKLAFENEWEVKGITHPDELKKDMKGGFRKFQLFDLIFLDLLFDAKMQVTQQNVVDKIEKGELLGVQFLEWLTKNYSCPVVVLSGFLFDAVAEKLRKTYPYLLLKAKPVDLYAPAFQGNVEHYARTFYRCKREMLFDRPTKEAIKRFDELIGRKPE